MKNGFTLAELLIALVILGVIATFTIPKVLTAQQDTKFKAIGKEAAGMISAAYSAYKQNNAASATTEPHELTAYMNYVSIDTTSLVDGLTGSTSQTCSTARLCLVLHNGAKLRVPAAGSGMSFGGTAATNAVWLHLDPDGVYSGSTTGPGKTLEFWLYYNGRLVTRGTAESNTCNQATCVSGSTALEPAWFDWN